MAREVVNLTMPLYPYMPLGSAWAFDVPFQTEPIRTYEDGGAQLDYFQFSTETGTHIVTAARHDPKGKLIGDLDFADLVDRRTALVDIPKTEREQISREDIERSVSECQCLDGADSVLIRTGWGEVRRCDEMGDRFVLDAPSFSDAAATLLANILIRKSITMLVVDIPYLTGGGRSHMRTEWGSTASWLRPPWPSEQAKAYLRLYTPEKMDSDWGAARELYKIGTVVVGACNMNAIVGNRVLITALPFFVEGSPSAPVTIIAIPDSE